MRSKLLVLILALLASGNATPAGSETTGAVLVGASAANITPFTVIPAATTLRAATTDVDPGSDVSVSNPDGALEPVSDELLPDELGAVLPAGSCDDPVSFPGQVTASGVWGEVY